MRHNNYAINIKYIPLRFMPITIELSLVDDPLEPIVSNFDNYYYVHPANGCTAANSSTTWQIQNVEAKCGIYNT